MAGAATGGVGNLADQAQDGVPHRIDVVGGFWVPAHLQHMVCREMCSGTDRWGVIVEGRDTVVRHERNTTMRHPHRFFMLVAVVALALAACAESAEPASLPTDDGSDSGSAAGGTCLQGEPDCADTGGDMVAQPLPGDAAVSGGMTANGGLTVSEALESEATGVIAVQGFFFDDGTGPRLCDALAESYPPQCGVAWLPITGHETAIDAPVVEERGVTWTDVAVTLFGEIVDGTLVVDPTVTG